MSLPLGVSLKTVCAARCDRELAEVADEQVAVVGECGRDDVALARRDVDDAADPAGPGIDAVDLTMVGLDRIELAAHCDHRVPGAVGLEVRGIRVRDRVRLDEGAEVRDLGRCAVVVDADDPVIGVDVAVRAAGAGEQRVQPCRR